MTPELQTEPVWHGLSGTELVQWVTQCYQASKDSRREIEEKWLDAWDLYNNVFDFGGKKDWQAQVPIPKVPQAIEILANSFTQSFTEDAEAVSASARYKKDAWLVPAAELWVRQWLEHVGFPEKLHESIKMGLITGLLSMKAFWSEQPPKESQGMDLLGALLLGEPEPEPESSELVVDTVNPEGLFPDNYGDRKWVVLEKEIDLHELRALARKPGSGYELSALRSGLPGSKSEGSEQWRSARADALESTSSGWRQRVLLWEFYGELVDQEGNLLAENVTFTVANKTVLIRKPREIDNWPVVWGPLVMKPFGVWHRTPVHDVVALAKALTELTCLLLDAAAYAATRAWEADPMALDDPTDLLDGVSPGKVFLKSVSARPNQHAIEALNTGRIPTDAMAVIQMLSFDIEEGLSVNEMVRGMPSRAGKDQTLGEVQMKFQQVASLMSQVARNIEVQFLDKLLDRVLLLCVKHQPLGNFNFEALAETMPPEDLLRLQSLSQDRELLVEAFVGTIKVRCRALSTMLDRQKQLGRLMQAIQVLSQSPAVTQLNWQVLARELFRNLGLPPEKFLLPEQEAPPPNLPPPPQPPGLQQANAGEAPTPQLPAQQGFAQLSGG